MLATAASEVAVACDRVERASATASVTLTVHIDLHGAGLPPAALGLLEHLRDLAAVADVTVARSGAEVPGVDVSGAEVSGAGPEPVDRTAGIRTRVVRRSGGEPVSHTGGPALRIYTASRMVLRDGAPVRLTRREYDLLLFLCEHPRRVFGRSQLLRHVWGYEMVSGERTVDVHVRRLRVKLGDRGPLIATVRGVGYRLDDATQVTVVTDGE